MKGTVFLEPASTASQHLRPIIDGTTEDGVPFFECSQIEIKGAYLSCTPKRQTDPGLWQYIILSGKDVAVVTNG